MNESDNLKHDILQVVSSYNRGVIPRTILVGEFLDSYNFEQIDGVISSLLDDFVIDMIVDYPPEDSDIYNGRPIWNIKLLSEDEANEIRNLPPIKLALLRLLQKTDDSTFPGELPVEEVRKILQEQGFDETKVERLLSVKGRVRIHRTTKNGSLVRCYYIIPEYKKTEEYKQEMEHIHREWDEKDRRRQYRTDVLDLADLIIAAVRKSKSQISRDDIVQQLPDFPSEYIDDAFTTAIEDGDIELAEEIDGEAWYRLPPQSEEDVDY